MNPLTPEQINALLDGPGGPVVHLVGAGGCGMSGLGHLLLDLGCKVHGSDLRLNEEIRQLRSRGAEIHLGHDPGRLLEAKPSLVVYSSAILSANSELQAARAERMPIVRRAALLSALQRRQRGICVAGTHGKTTTTALLAYALEQAGADPSYAIGAITPQLSAHARVGGLPPGRSAGRPAPDPDRWFVVETDESDGTLREFAPEHAIFLNVDEEHLDYYANIEAVCREFSEFAGRTRGRIVFCADDPRLRAMFASRAGSVSYGFDPLAAYRAVPLAGAVSRVGEVSKFAVWHGTGALGEFETGLLGEKNMLNATAVIGLLHQIGFAPAVIARGLRGFRGAARRQQELYRGRGLRLFDDYGHHPREIEATLSALKELGGRRLLVAFQPHRFTRTLHLAGQFAHCFHGADRLWLTDIYSAGEAKIPGIHTGMLAEAVRAQGQEAEYVANLADLNKSIRAALEPGDVLLYLGAGDITGAAREMAETLRSEPAAPAEDRFSKLRALVSPQTLLLRDEPLAKRTTLRVGGKADFYAEPATESELAGLILYCREQRIHFTVLGRGSNLLVRDGGVRGLVVSLGHPAFSRIETLGAELHCGAGARLKAVSTEARRRGLAGLEFLEGIPGSVGGALRMNAGAMGSWMFEVVESVRFMDDSGQVLERRAAEVYVEYRGCPLFKNHIALGAVLKGEPAERGRIEETAAVFNQRRWSSQPAAPSAGCIFKNPAQIPAGKLIEELGLRGSGVGGASISEVHGNFIVNRGGATARDVLALIEIVRERARTARGIDLQTEVEILGENE
jgi:UDP-N-acetylmuramate--alanine ligase